MRGPEGKYTPEFRIWGSMKQRCLNPNSKYFKHYGGRGISICTSWLASFDNFLSDMGRRPTDNHEIDRIDVNGNYSRDNCRWATKKQQMRNTRRAVTWTIGGITKSAADWAEELGMSIKAARNRAYRGSSETAAISARHYKNLQQYTCNGITKTAREWAKESGTRVSVIHARASRGVPLDYQSRERPKRSRLLPPDAYASTAA